MCDVKRVLFVCDENRYRSPTAEKLYRDTPGLEVRSAGLSPSAKVRFTGELLEWAHLTFVMERRQRNKIHKLHPDLYRRKKIICLYIADDYEFMDPLLVSLLKSKLSPYLGRPEEG